MPKIRAFKPLPTLALGESSMVEVGEDAVAIGNPQGLEHTVSAGVISAFRQAEGFRLIQTSGPISPGSSGGPLFDLTGRVIGITSAPPPASSPRARRTSTSPSRPSTPGRS